MNAGPFGLKQLNIRILDIAMVFYFIKICPETRCYSYLSSDRVINCARHLEYEMGRRGTSVDVLRLQLKFLDVGLKLKYVSF